MWGFFCEVGVGGLGVMGGGDLNFQMGTRPEKSLVRSLCTINFVDIPKRNMF